MRDPVEMTYAYSGTVLRPVAAPLAVLHLWFSEDPVPVAGYAPYMHSSGKPRSAPATRRQELLRSTLHLYHAWVCKPIKSE